MPRDQYTEVSLAEPMPHKLKPSKLITSRHSYFKNDEIKYPYQPTRLRILREAAYQPYAEGKDSLLELASIFKPYGSGYEAWSDLVLLNYGISNFVVGALSAVFSPLSFMRNMISYMKAFPASSWLTVLPNFIVNFVCAAIETLCDLIANLISAVKGVGQIAFGLVSPLLVLFKAVLITLPAYCIYAGCSSKKGRKASAEDTSTQSPHTRNSMGTYLIPVDESGETKINVVDLLSAAEVVLGGATVALAGITLLALGVTVLGAGLTLASPLAVITFAAIVSTMSPSISSSKAGQPVREDHEDEEGYTSEGYGNN